MSLTGGRLMCVLNAFSHHLSTLALDAKQRDSGTTVREVHPGGTKPSLQLTLASLVRARRSEAGGAVYRCARPTGFTTRYPAAAIHNFAAR